MRVLRVYRVLPLSNVGVEIWNIVVKWSASSGGPKPHNMYHQCPLAADPRTQNSRCFSKANRPESLGGLGSSYTDLDAYYLPLYPTCNNHSGNIIKNQDRHDAVTLAAESQWPRAGCGGDDRAYCICIGRCAETSE